MANIKFLKAVFTYSKNKFTLGGVTMYSGKKYAYSKEIVSQALLSKDRELKSDHYRIFPVRDKESGRLSVWAKGENGDTHLLRYAQDQGVAERLIGESDKAFETFRKKD